MPELVGSKNDESKLRYDLVPELAEEEFVKVLTHGAAKYTKRAPDGTVLREGADNWRLVPELQRRYFAAARRHMKAWRKGERIDPEFNCHHLAHALCCLAFLLEIDLEAIRDANHLLSVMTDNPRPNGTEHRP